MDRLEIGSPPGPPSGVRELGNEDVARSARVLARAFYDDPLMRWLVPDAERREGRLEAAFALNVRLAWLPLGASQCTTDGAGVAMWMPPGTWKLSWATQLRMAPGLLRALKGDLVRLVKVESAIEKRHPVAPHWYLAAVGVEPERQRQGLGSGLLAPVLERCDAERIPTYLETASEPARRLYERHGFEVTDECDVEGVAIWLMWRNPHG